MAAAVDIVIYVLKPRIVMGFSGGRFEVGGESTHSRADGLGAGARVL